MAESPLNNASGPVTVTLKSNGQTLPLSTPILSIVVRKRANRIAVATLELEDGDTPKQDFPLSNQETFVPGAKIEILAGYASKEESIFEGIVVRHGLRVSAAEGGRLVIECRDPAATLAAGRKNARYENLKDSEVIAKILQAASLEAEVAETSVQHPELVQYYCSDWDFLLTRAEANGLLVWVEDGKVRVQPPDTSGAPGLEVTHGKDLISFEADVDARTQYSKVEAVGWNEGEQQVVASEVAGGSAPTLGNLQPGDLSKVLAAPPLRLQSSVCAEQPQLDAWANSQQVKSDLARVCGRLRFAGSAKAKLGTVLSVIGIGDRFSGQLLATGISHHLRAGSWVTEVQFGLPPQWFSERRDLAAPSASGLVPGIAGLHVGVVDKLQDPTGQNLVRVSLPLVAPSGQPQGESVWARMAQFYASAQAGCLFWPEVGDEVILGFVNEDPAHPVVLGSLYSKKRQPAVALGGDEDANEIKALVTKSQLTLQFDEKNKAITVRTPGENEITLSDEAKSITLQDANGNQVLLNEQGITLQSDKDITLKAGGNLSMDAKSTASLAGANVSATAQASLTATGQTSAELSASGTTTVKGLMVQIN